MKDVRLGINEEVIASVGKAEFDGSKRRSRLEG